MRVGWLVWVLGCGFSAVVLEARDRQRLPVFLADNHAESFAWMARNFDLDEELWLVLVDAHTDATAAERSEELREQVRRVVSVAQRAERIEAWRATGRLQAFNWIEPLMPRPIGRVVWVPKIDLAPGEAESLTAGAEAALDGRLEVEPRGAGALAGRWQTMAARELEQWAPEGLQRVVLSIDLDFFAGMEGEAQAVAMDGIWRRAMDWPGLVGVSIAVSRPWLGDDGEADRLVRLATGLVARTRGAQLELDASLDDRPDESVRASEFLTGPPPRWDAAAASVATRALWANMGSRLRVTDRAREWGERLVPAALSIAADGGEMDCDGVWRFDRADAPVLRVGGVDDGTGRVRWHALRPAREAYDFLPHTGLGKEFSESPGRWVYEGRHDLGETDDLALAPGVWSAGGAGRVRIEAELETARGWLPVPPIEIRLTEGSGFRRGMSECFHMPYGFGIAMIAEDELEAVETGWGADCSNLMVHAWRRAGVRLGWGDPGRLREQLETLAEGVTIEAAVEVSAESIERGVVVDFGRHMAALWEDRAPVGVLDGGDLVLHHLGGFPEIVALAELAETRAVFSVRGLGAPVRRREVKVAGDVVLAGAERVVIDGFDKGGAGLLLVNLEGVPSMGEPQSPVRYDFRFPAERLGWLRGRGVDAVSLANNHAGDAGRAGLVEGIAAIRAAGMGVFGAGRDEVEACQPWITKVDGVEIAVFGVCLVDGMVAGPDTAGIAHLPTHEERLDRALRGAAGSGADVIVLIHGGREYQGEVDAAQRRWARWLVRRGARVVAGSHPHVVQRHELHGGASIGYSQGNAVYPAALRGADSGEVRVFVLEDRGGIGD
jgi:hypothetical protein